MLHVPVSMSTIVKGERGDESLGTSSNATDNSVEGESSLETS